MKLRTLSRVILGCALAVGCALISRPVSAADAPRKIDVSVKRFAYIPADITLKKGEPVVLTFQSTDVTHGIRFKELDLQTDIRKDASSELSFTPTKTGDFVGHCSRFCGSGHGAMTLTLHVTE